MVLHDAVTLYAQNVLGYTPLGAGLALIPSSLSVAFGAKLAPRLMARIGARQVAISGTLVAVVGMAWQSTMSADGTYLTGGALGLAVLSTIAASRTGGAVSAEALTAGYALAFRAGAGALLAGVVLMLIWLPRRKSTA